MNDLLDQRADFDFALAGAKQNNELVRCPSGRSIYFDWILANREGAIFFYLLREPEHTDEDITFAKAKLRNERDVVGIHVVTRP